MSRLPNAFLALAVITLLFSRSVVRAAPPPAHTQHTMETSRVWNRDQTIDGPPFDTGELTSQCFTGAPWGANSWGIEASSWVNSPTYAIDTAHFHSGGQAGALSARDSSNHWSFARYIQGDVWGGSNCGPIPWHLPEPLPTHANQLTLHADVYRDNHSLDSANQSWVMLAFNLWFSSPDLPSGDDKTGRKPLVMDLMLFNDCNWSNCGPRTFEDEYGYHYQAVIGETPLQAWQPWSIDLDYHIQQALAYAWPSGSISGSGPSLHLYQLELVAEVKQAEVAARVDNFYIEYQHPQSIGLESLDWPGSIYRWLDVANQAYSADYRQSYTYGDAAVQVDYQPIGGVLQGTLTATGLKPNFAYQLKLAGIPGTAANERIGLAGRWWQEEWNGSAWASGHNLNQRGDGTSPNPNDLIYIDLHDEPDPAGTSPTGLRYRYTGYLVFDYLITDELGNATLNFETDSSYHVLWATNDSDGNDGLGHSDRESDDGPLITATFDADESPAYPDSGGNDYLPMTVSVFGEWERLPVGGVFLAPGTYSADILLTEESFHGSGGTYAGGWAAAVGAPLSFTIEAPTAVELASFTAAAESDRVLLLWETTSDAGNRGFHTHRTTGSPGPLTRLNEQLIPCSFPVSPLGARYSFADDTAAPGETYFYWLDILRLDGSTRRHGPIIVTVPLAAPYRLFLPCIPAEAR